MPKDSFIYTLLSSPSHPQSVFYLPSLTALFTPLLPTQLERPLANFLHEVQGSLIPRAWPLSRPLEIAWALELMFVLRLESVESLLGCTVKSLPFLLPLSPDLCDQRQPHSLVTQFSCFGPS